MYIVFEGIDTSGKSTQVEILGRLYGDIIMTKEPGGTEFGAHIRRLLLHIHKGLGNKSELFLFLADRAEHFHKVIKPNSNKTIISDRSLISGMAYALSDNEDFDYDFLYRLNEFALEGILPEKIVFFKMNENLLTKRLSEKPHDTIEKRGIGYLLNVQNKMEEIMEKLDIEVLVIDASWEIKKITKQIERFIL